MLVGVSKSEWFTLGSLSIREPENWSFGFVAGFRVSMRNHRTPPNHRLGSTMKGDVGGQKQEARSVFGSTRPRGWGRFRDRLGERRGVSFCASTLLDVVFYREARLGAQSSSSSGRAEWVSPLPAHFSTPARFFGFFLFFLLQDGLFAFLELKDFCFLREMNDGWKEGKRNHPLEKALLQSTMCLVGRSIARKRQKP